MNKINDIPVSINMCEKRLSLIRCLCPGGFKWHLSCSFCIVLCLIIYGPRQANLVLIAYASSEGSGEPAHPRSLARTFAARPYKQ